MRSSWRRVSNSGACKDKIPVWSNYDESLWRHQNENFILITKNFLLAQQIQSGRQNMSSYQLHYKCISWWIYSNCVRQLFGECDGRRCACSSRALGEVEFNNAHIHSIDHFRIPQDKKTTTVYVRCRIPTPTSFLFASLWSIPTRLRTWVVDGFRKFAIIALLHRFC